MSITTIIITKNEERNIVDCIESVKFSKQIIVVDNDSTDRTVELAKRNGAEVITEKFSDFSKQREAGMKHVKGDWILYLDADERIDNQLKSEIETVVDREDAKDVYKLQRKNFYFGKYEWNKIEKMERLFKKDVLSGWFGEIHESPVFKGNLGEFKGFIDHYTHSDLTSMLSKTIKWSDIEAENRFSAKHPKMTWWRFPRVMLGAFLTYYVKQKGYKVGTAGLVESIFQSYSAFVTYAKLWELQNKDIRS